MLSRDLPAGWVAAVDDRSGVTEDARQREREEGEPDRTLPEMPDVGIQRFSAGDGEKDSAEHGKAREAIPRHE